MTDILYKQSPALWSVDVLASHGHQVVTDLARDAAASSSTMRYLLGRCMLAMERLGTHKEMGLSSPVHFATQHLKMSENLAKTALRVSRQLEELPLLALAVLHAEIEWSQIREVASVATPETEEMWRKLCIELNCKQIQILVAATPKGGVPGEIASKLPRKTSEYRCRFQPEVVVLIERGLQKMSRKLDKPIMFREAVERFFTEFLADKPYDEAAEKMLEEARKDFLAGRIQQEPLVMKAREVAREFGLLEESEEGGSDENRQFTQPEEPAGFLSLAESGERAGFTEQAGVEELAGFTEQADATKQAYVEEQAGAGEQPVFAKHVGVEGLDGFTEQDDATKQAYAEEQVGAEEQSVFTQQVGFEESIAFSEQADVKEQAGATKQDGVEEFRGPTEQAYAEEEVGSGEQAVVEELSASTKQVDTKEQAESANQVGSRDKPVSMSRQIATPSAECPSPPDLTPSVECPSMLPLSLDSLSQEESLKASALQALGDLQQAIGGSFSWEAWENGEQSPTKLSHVGTPSPHSTTSTQSVDRDPPHPRQEDSHDHPKRPTSKVTRLNTPFQGQHSQGQFQPQAAALLNELMAHLKFNPNSRFPTKAQRKALLRRDSYCCRTPGCTNHLFLEIHHIKRYSQGGKTLPELLVTLCPRCHKNTEEGKLFIRLAETGQLIFTDQHGYNLEDVRRRERAIWLDYWLGWKGKETDSHWARAVGFSESVA